MAKRDVGMAGSSGYDSEFYNTTRSGYVVPNTRTMALQGMDPKKQFADSRAQEKRVRARGREGLAMSDRDAARMKAVDGNTNGAFGNQGPEFYNEEDFRAKIYKDDATRRENAFKRGQEARQTIRQQDRVGAVQQKFGDNSFKPYSSVMPTLSKQIMSENAKRK
jgi:hypothetical protein